MAQLFLNVCIFLLIWFDETYLILQHRLTRNCPSFRGAKNIWCRNVYFMAKCEKLTCCEFKLTWNIFLSFDWKVHIFFNIYRKRCAILIDEKKVLQSLRVVQKRIIAYLLCSCYRIILKAFQSVPGHGNLNMKSKLETNEFLHYYLCIPL